ncbi:TetR/AcrR family transcriptional regulator C-terminal domain-containing protein [Protaetiibacter sp. SSC-01]|uniref:TetR/AcrR family transcriptional regulator C-terminal domain-containing protein n=1 Tax=Protaetiibacter sp. SSC-01 TaxID=2759943 RepID=UPI00165692D1|nr:TetR/AcrR family transcriptional regulator C-terminal domain-containing protein [Protaetiibacter sp. SSC-01]QNO38374.1 TetR/AcrR family transcriptional regulator C-terminal domain-containing protein [Protaetiibacter sp. SSC-01]
MAGTTRAPREPLTRERIIDAAVAVADEAGLAGVSMRSVGRQLGVEAMSLYHHISGKEQLLDELADWVFARFRAPGLDDGWREGTRARAVSMREVLSAHPWGLGLVESRRAAGESTLAFHDAVLGNLRRGGLGVTLAAHAFSLVDAYVYGFVLTEQRLPIAPGESVEAYTEELAIAAERYPHMTEMVQTMIAGRDYSYGDEFEVGLELILDALEARHAAEARGGA